MKKGRKKMFCCLAIAEVAKSASDAKAEITEFSYNPETGKLEASEIKSAPKLPADQHHLAVDQRMARRAEADAAK